MESEQFRIRRRGRAKTDLEGTLRKAWYHLRLSVRYHARVPTWDAIVLTAASPEQAQLYQWQLDRAKRIGRIAASTVTLAVPDPQGQRIGSGAATLNAIFALAQHYQQLSINNSLVDSYCNNTLFIHYFEKEKERLCAISRAYELFVIYVFVLRRVRFRIAIVSILLNFLVYSKFSCLTDCYILSGGNRYKHLQCHVFNTWVY